MLESHKMCKKPLLVFFPFQSFKQQEKKNQPNLFVFWLLSYETAVSTAPNVVAEGITKADCAIPT